MGPGNEVEGTLGLRLRKKGQRDLGRGRGQAHKGRKKAQNRCGVQGSW